MGVDGTMAQAHGTMSLPKMELPSGHRWFAPDCCVVQGPQYWEVLVGGLLIGRFEPKDYGTRNVILVLLAKERRIHLGRMAEAFGLTDDGLLLIRRQYEREGLAAVVARRRGGNRQVKLKPELRRRLSKLFQKGCSVDEARARIGNRVSRSAVGVVRAAWGRERARRQQVESAVETPCEMAPTAQAELPIAQAAIEVSATTATETAIASPLFESKPDESDPGDPEDAASLAVRDVEGGRHIQHVGTWLLIAMLHRLGLFDRVASLCQKAKQAVKVRLAIEGFVAAVALSQKCAEGVRRLATPTAHLLFRAARAPSAPWVRRTLHEFADTDKTAAALHFGMAGDYIRFACNESEEGPVVFYIDNHLRRYTGKHVLRKGWRMQDRRALPGKSDYYVHDEDGRSVLRVDVPDHGSLTAYLTPIARALRMALLPEERVLVAFDRGGAFPSQLAELREDGFEFATYERAPYQTLSKSAFNRTATFTDDNGEEEAIQYVETRANLGNGRGRVRRIACLMPDGHQVNILAISKEPAERVIVVMRGRWGQENALKHGVERWGINQLDGREVEPYAEDTIIPNPARRRLDRALRLAQGREGAARRQLARLKKRAPGRAIVEKDLAEALALQEKLVALRPSVPTHVPLMETDLAGKLVYHPGRYKTTMDTIRIACANAESDFASRLAPYLPVSAEAKKAIGNLFASPGEVRVGKSAITVRLASAGTGPELAAFGTFLREVNAMALMLPGDQHRRRLKFETQVS
ncbi:MAG: hypothetical protein HY698_05525 [Deltaproteobacteria bacterium]|nr:hypothetical protein [Deltaproteobacteria bacterium]